MSRFSKAHKGFTLLELLVVVIIIGILATVALPQFGKAIDRAREAEANNIVSAVLSAEMAYYQENNKFTATVNDLLVTIPSLKDWQDIGTGAAGAASIVVDTAPDPDKVSIEIDGTKHNHTTHKVKGEVDGTGKKTFTYTGR